MTLHILRIGSYSHDTVLRCFASLQANDGLILISEGVNLLRQAPRLAMQLAQTLAQTEKRNDVSVKLYALADDLAARAIKVTDSTVETVNIEQWVQLTLDYNKTITWQ